MKNFFKVVLSSLVLISMMSINALATDNVPEVQAEGMILIDVKTGKVLAEKNSKNKFAPASTTKIMTALLTLENTKLTDMVKVGENPPLAIGSSIALKEGDIYSVEELLLALLLESSNDSAVALAEYISGSEKEFAKLMTERAKELGATNTNFVNASGLFEEDHYTTPYDLSLIMEEVIKHEDFNRMSRVISHEMPVSRVDNESKWLNNSTSMFNPNSKDYYEPLISSKKGYTDLARFSYVAAAQKDDQLLISVLMKAEFRKDIYIDSLALFEYGFNNFDTISLYKKGDTVTDIIINETKIPLITNEDVYYLIDKTSNSLSKGTQITDKTNLSPKLKIQEKDLSKTSFKKGDKILSTDILINNKVIKNIPLISGVTVEYKPTQNILNFIKSKLLFIGLGILTIFIIIYIIYDKFVHFRYRRRARKIIFRSRRKNKLHW